MISVLKHPGWLFDIGNYTTQLYGDCNKIVIRILINQSV